MLPDQEAASEGQFAGGSCKGLAGDCFRAASKFNDHIARPDDGNPFFRCALSLTHTGFERLLADGLVREDPDPNLSTALHVPGGGDTRRLDLLACHPAALQNLKAEFAEIQLIASLRKTSDITALYLSVLYSFWH